MNSNRYTRRRTFGTVTTVVLGVFFLFAVLLPLISVMTNLRDADVSAILSHPQTVPAILNSLKASVTATFLSIALAFAAAWCVNRTGIRRTALFDILLVIPMLIPSISHGTGLIILLGDNGILTKLFGLQKSIYGFAGIVMGSMLYAFPIAYLMISDILRYEDSTPYEAARTLGIPAKNRFFAITLPYLRKPMISVVFAVFTAIVTDYGVPLMVGGMYKTLPALMYEETIHRMNYAKGSVFGLILLLPAVIAFLFDLLSGKDRTGNSNIKPFRTAGTPAGKCVSYIVLTLITVCVLLPVASFVPGAFAAIFEGAFNQQSFAVRLTVHDVAVTVGHAFPVDMGFAQIHQPPYNGDFRIAGAGVFLFGVVPVKFIADVHVIIYDFGR